MNGIFNALKGFLKEKVIVALMKKILGSAIGGFKAWFVQFVLENLWDEIVDPLLNAGLVELKYIKHKIEGSITAEKIIAARKAQNADDYNSGIDDLLS